MALRADSEVRHFLIMSAEGDVKRDHVRPHQRSVTVTSTTQLLTARAPLWMSGRLLTTPSGDGVRFQYQHGGYLDHGPFYAANSFTDPRPGRTIVDGGIPEEDLPPDAALEKSWNGSLAVPREIFVFQIPRVVGSLQSALGDISPFELRPEPDGNNTTTDRLDFGREAGRGTELEQLREASHQYSAAAVTLPESDSITSRGIFQTRSTSWELEAIVAVGAGCQDVGFHLRHNADLSIRATVTFSVATETIVVDRHASNADPAINNCPDAGPFTLLTTREAEGRDSLEKFRIRILSDGDILEVFANDRFALATMVYWGSSSDMGGLTVFALGSVGSAVFETITVWDGLEL